jgi:cell division protein ZipA
LAAELRWILLAICVPVLAAIWWWTARRGRQAPGNSDLREYTQSSAEPVQEPAPYREVESYRDGPESRSWGVPPLEPLSIRTGDFDSVHVMDTPMTATPKPVDMPFDLRDPVEHDSAPRLRESAPENHIPWAEEPPPRAESFAPPAAGEPSASAAEPPPSMTATPAAPSPRERAAPAGPSGPNAQPIHNAQPVPSAPAAPAETANSSETQHIVSLRVCAAGESSWTGGDLLNAFESHGLAYGRYKVFHRKHTDGRTLFCAASLVEPGTFDAARMLEEEFSGLALFAVLPGPADPRQTIELLIAAANGLADTLQGAVQDAAGSPLSPDRADALREDVARFHASLTPN